MLSTSDNFRAVSLSRPRCTLECGSYANLVRFWESHLALGGGELPGRAPGPAGQRFLLGLRLSDGNVFWLKARVTRVAASPPSYWVCFAPLDDAQRTYLGSVRGMVAAASARQRATHARLRDADHALARAELATALEVYRSLGDLPAALAGIEVVAAVQLAERGQIDAAIARFERALAHEPSNQRAAHGVRVMRSLALARRGAGAAGST